MKNRRYIISQLKENYRRVSNIIITVIS